MRKLNIVMVEGRVSSCQVGATNRGDEAWSCLMTVGSGKRVVFVRVNAYDALAAWAKDFVKPKTNIIVIGELMPRWPNVYRGPCPADRIAGTQVSCRNAEKQMRENKGLLVEVRAKRIALAEGEDRWS